MHSRGSSPTSQTSCWASARPDGDRGTAAPPRNLRAEHLTRLRTPTAFVHGTRDPFGTLEELQTARDLIPARTTLLSVPGGHDLGWTLRKRNPDLPHRIAATLLDLAAQQ